MSQDANTQPSLSVFGEGFQTAILGYCMKDVAFLANCRAMLKPEWFGKLQFIDTCQAIFKIYDEKANDSNIDIRIPTPLEIKTHLNIIFNSPADKQLRVQTIDICLATAKEENISLETVKKHMTGWVRMMKLRDLMEEAASKFRRKDFENCINWVDNKIADVKQSTFMSEVRESFSDPVGFLQAFNEELDSSCCTMGSTSIDEVLRTGARLPYSPNERMYSKMTKGSLQPGDLTVLIGATNTGKTTACVTLVASNILMGKHVMFISHEQEPKQIKVRILSCLMTMTSPDLQTSTQDLFEKGPVVDEYKKRLNFLASILEERLCYIHYAKPGGMFVEDVVAMIEREQAKKLYDRVKKTGENKGFDLVVEDYPSKLKSRVTAKSQGWEEKTYVYNEFLNLAQCHRFHVVAPVQSNRSGVRVSRGEADDARPLDVDDIGEAYGISTIAANVITINRSAIDISLNLLRFFVAKCRSPGKGVTIITKSDFASGRTYAIDGKAYIVAAGVERPSAATMAQYFGLMPNETAPIPVNNEVVVAGTPPPVDPSILAIPTQLRPQA